MRIKVIAFALLLHFFTSLGTVIADAETQGCSDDLDLFCGTPLEGYFEDAQDTEVTVNPFRFAGGLINVLRTVRVVTWYDYALLNEAGNIVVQLYTWVVRIFLVAVILYWAWEAYKVIAPTLGRFLTR